MEPRCVTARPVPSEQLPQTCTPGPKLHPAAHVSTATMQGPGEPQAPGWAARGSTATYSQGRPAAFTLGHLCPPLLLPWRSCSSDELMEPAPHNHSWGSRTVHSRSSSREEGNSSNLSPTEEVTEKPIKENISNRRMELVHLHQELLWGLQENFGEHQP